MILKIIKYLFANKPKTTISYQQIGRGIEDCSPVYFINELPEDFLIIDVETTGLNPHVDSIIDVGIIRCFKGKIVDRYSSLVNPMRKIPYEITRMTGITNRMVKKQPTIDRVINEVYKRIVTVPYIAGYNVNFDINFINKALINNGYSISRVDAFDVLELAREALPYNKVPDKKLETLKNYFNIKGTSHKALSDCEVTLEVFKRCLEIKQANDKTYREKQATLISKFNENEKLFISKLKDELSKIGLENYLGFNVLSNKTINFDVDGKQIGRVKLSGRKYKMQILDYNNGIFGGVWLDIDDVTEAINNIKYWIQYAKNLEIRSLDIGGGDYEEKSSKES